jgi:hypothetical protein
MMVMATPVASASNHNHQTDNADQHNGIKKVSLASYCVSRFKDLVDIVGGTCKFL